mmetsp:Transcript_32099/g.106243  ORF Transcript_32099/g.106243 Transcript_32099/m.106243 type:complete len:218 (+) Transcript_32099:562-1215(+)
MDAAQRARAAEPDRLPHLPRPRHTAHGSAAPRESRSSRMVVWPGPRYGARLSRRRHADRAQAAGRVVQRRWRFVGGGWLIPHQRGWAHRRRARPQGRGDGARRVRVDLPRGRLLRRRRRHLRAVRHALPRAGSPPLRNRRRRVALPRPAPLLALLLLHVPWLLAVCPMAPLVARPVGWARWEQERRATRSAARAARGLLRQSGVCGRKGDRHIQGRE